MAATRTPVFVDCDNTMGIPGQEIDDGLTILYLLGCPSVEIVGISAAHGNGTVDDAMHATRTLLDRVGAIIPLFAGADPPAAQTGSTAGTGWRTKSEAAAALVSASFEYEGRLVVLGLGALSSIAGAGLLDTGFYRRLAAIKVMGGYLGPLRFRREVRELNFSSDAEASSAVLHAPVPVTIMSAQLCLNARFGRRELLLHNWGPGWLKASVREWAKTFGEVEGRRGFYLWDLLPAASVVQPERFPERLVRLLSTVSDLETGSLRVTDLGTDLDRSGAADAPRAQSDTPGADHREPGVVDLPLEVIRADRFARECARRWRLGVLRAS